MIELTLLILGGIILGLVGGIIIRHMVFSHKNVDKLVRDTKTIKDIDRRLDYLQTEVETVKRKWNR